MTVANHSSQEDNEKTDGHFARLIELARNGDPQAVGELIREYRDYLLLIANREFDQGLRAKLGPSDVVQQSLMAAQQNLAGFRGQTEAEFRGWLRQILKNDMRDAGRKYRGSKRRKIDLEHQIDDSRMNQPALMDQLHTPQTDALFREQARLLNEALTELSTRDQEILQLRNWQEQSFVEIGEHLGCSADAARKAWYRAILRLEEVIVRNNPGLKSTETQLPPACDG